MAASLTDAAYFAGLYEGEGSISVNNKVRGTSVQLQLVIDSTDREVLEALRVRIGLGRVYGPYQHKPNPQRMARKPMYRFVINRKGELVEAIEMMWPWLGSRRRAQLTRAVEQHPYLSVACCE